MEKKKRRHFPEEFKRQAVERIETSGLHLFEVAAALGVHESPLRRWARQLGQTAPLTARRRQSREVRGLSPADLAAENARLKRELQRAQAERDILKKAALIFGAATR